MFLKKTIYTLSILSISSAALASGYQISEYSSTNLGRAFAGSGLVGDDFSALAYNPAGMQLNQTSGIQGGASLIVLHADYRNVADNSPDMGKHDSTMARTLPHFFAQYKLNEQFTFGAGIYTPYGLIIDYNNNWSGRNHGILSELKAVDLSPAISYQPFKMLSIGASLNIQYADARLTGAGSTASGYSYTTDLNGKDTTSFGYSAGIVLTPVENLRLGVSYRSKVSHKLKGKVKQTIMGYINLKNDVSAKITTPELVLISGAYDVNRQLTLSAAARWTRWTRFDQLDIVSNAKTISSTTENWKNTWFYSVGADYKVNNNWTVRLGAAYDETVIKSPAYRTVRIPDGHRWFGSIGLSYATGNWQYDLGYTHVWMNGGNARQKDAASAERPNVHYNNAGAYMTSASIQYKF